MTTVTFRDGVICADTSLFCGYRYCGMVAKIVRGPAGQIAGASGDGSWAYEFLDWVFKGEEGDWPKPPQEADGSTGSAILIRVQRAESQIELFDCSGRCPVCLEFTAIGCGAALALGAMAAGADAMASLEVAANLDAYTRAPLVSLTLGGPAAWPEWR